MSWPRLCVGPDLSVPVLDEGHMETEVWVSACCVGSHQASFLGGKQLPGPFLICPVHGKSKEALSCHMFLLAQESRGVLGFGLAVLCVLMPILCVGSGGGGSACGSHHKCAGQTLWLCFTRTG